jgi:hypothetical protein
LDEKTQVSSASIPWRGPSCVIPLRSLSLDVVRLYGSFYITAIPFSAARPPSPTSSSGVSLLFTTLSPAKLFYLSRSFANPLALEPNVRITRTLRVGDQFKMVPSNVDNIVLGYL